MAPLSKDTFRNNIGLDAKQASELSTDRQADSGSEPFLHDVAYIVDSTVSTLQEPPATYYTSPSSINITNTTLDQAQLRRYSQNEKALRLGDVPPDSQAFQQFIVGSSRDI